MVKQLSLYCMNRFVFSLFVFSLIGASHAQNALILNNAVVINISGGAVLSIDQPHANGILVNGSGTGYIQSEAETNRVAWHINNGTGDHVIPFGVGGAKIDMRYNITTGGSASGTLVASTYPTVISNVPYPNVYAPAVTVMDSTGFVGASDHSLYTADRFWVLRDTDRPWVTKPTSTLTLTYRDNEYAPGNTITETDLRAQYWINSQWNPGWYTGTPLLGANNAAANQVNSINAGSNGNLYTWILVAQQHPLPIELMELKANCAADSKPIVEWVTSSESNNAFFTLLRSADGYVWDVVTNISGAGNSNTPLYYFFHDENAPEGALFYKLMQQDFDGTETEAGVVAVNCAGQMATGSYGLNVYSDNEHLVHVTYNAETEERLVFRLFDMRGRLIVEELVTSIGGNNHYILNVRPVANATYMMTITNSVKMESRKFFLQ